MIASGQFDFKSKQVSNYTEVVMRGTTFNPIIDADGKVYFGSTDSQNYTVLLTSISNDGVVSSEGINFFPRSPKVFDLQKIQDQWIMTSLDYQVDKKPQSAAMVSAIVVSDTGPKTTWQTRTSQEVIWMDNYPASNTYFSHRRIAQYPSEKNFFWLIGGNQSFVKFDLQTGEMIN